MNEKGVVSLFATEPDHYTYIRRNKPDKSIRVSSNAEIGYDPAGKAVIREEFREPGAMILFVGVQ